MKRLLFALLFTALVASAQFQSGQTYTKDGVKIYLVDQPTKPATGFCVHADDNQVVGFDVTFTFVSNAEIYRTKVWLENGPDHSAFFILRQACDDMIGSKTAAIRSIEVKLLKVSGSTKF